MFFNKLIARQRPGSRTCLEGGCPAAVPLRSLFVLFTEIQYKVESPGQHRADANGEGVEWSGIGAQSLKKCSFFKNEVANGKKLEKFLDIVRSGCLSKEDASGGGWRR